MRQHREEALTRIQEREAEQSKARDEAKRLNEKFALNEMMRVSRKVEEAGDQWYMMHLSLSFFYWHSEATGSYTASTAHEYMENIAYFNHIHTIKPTNRLRQVHKSTIVDYGNS